MPTHSLSARFDEEVAKELGYLSAVFMSQECKGTEIIMPTTELKEVPDRIGLYGFAYTRSTLTQELAILLEEVGVAIKAVENEQKNIKWKGSEKDSGLKGAKLALSDIRTLISNRINNLQKE